MKKDRKIGTNAALTLSILFCLGSFLMTQHHSYAQENTLPVFDRLTMPDGHAIRFGIWPCPKGKTLGSVILLNGRSEFMEKYAETIGELNQRGFAVFSFDWRGQGLSTRMLANKHKGFIQSYNIYINDLELFFTRIVQPEATPPFILLAHSMGGHIALRFIHNHPEVQGRAILVSPMIDLFTSSLSRRFVRFITGIAIRTGAADSYVIGSGDYRPDRHRFKGNRLTSDPVRFMNGKKAIENNSDLALGGVTYGWLSATFESIDILTGPGYVAGIHMPILLVSAGSDKVVSIKAQRQICRSMKDCRFIEIPGARHEILMETDAIRSIFWDAFDRFSGAESLGH